MHFLSLISTNDAIETSASELLTAVSYFYYSKDKTSRDRDKHRDRS